MEKICVDYLRQSDLTYVHVWNDSGTIESLAELNYFGAPDKDLTELDCLDQLTGMDCFETQIKTWQG